MTREKPIPSVGPFKLTEDEFIGLEFLRQEDERQLRKTGLHATWSGRVLTIKVKGFIFDILTESKISNLDLD